MKRFLPGQRGFIPLIALVAVAAILALVGFWILDRPQPRLASNNAIPSTSVKDSATDQEIAGWKTYTNIPVGYEIKYPPFLKVTERNFGGGERVTIISDMELVSSAVFPGGDDILATETRDQSGPKTPEIYRGFLLDIRWSQAAYLSPKELSERDKININGWNAYRADDAFKNNGYEGKYSYITIEDSFKDQLKLYASFNGGKKEYAGLLDKMLATFRFLNNGQTKTEFPPPFTQVEWEQTTSQKDYSFRNPANNGDYVKKVGFLTVSKIYQQFPREIAGNFQDYYMQWFDERGWRVIDGSGGDLKRYEEHELEYYKDGRHFRFGLNKLPAGFRFFFVTD